MVRIIISKDLFAGCDAEVAVAYAALQAAARNWAGEELVHKARRGCCPAHRHSALRPWRGFRHAPAKPGLALAT